MARQRGRNPAPLRMVIALAVCLLAVALLGRWFTLPSPQGTAHWQLDFNAQNMARQARYRSGTSLWRWWLVLSPFVTALLCAAVRPIRRRCVAAVQRVPFLRTPGRCALLCAGLLAVARLSAVPAQLVLLQRAREWKLTSQSVWDYVQSLASNLALQSLLVFLVGSLVLRLVRKWPHTWSTRLAAIAALGLAGIGLLPMFQGFTPEHTTPLPAGSTSEMLHALAARAGLASVPIRVSTAPGTNDGVNAYASGSGPFARIVLQRAALTRTSPDELASIVAHELGHVKAHDPLLTACAGGCVVGMVLAGCGWVRQRRGFLAGETTGLLPHAVPALVLLWTVLQIGSLPIVNAISRGVETRADIAALELTSDPHTFVLMMRRVGVVNLAYIGDDAPNEWLRSHPTIVQRITNARTWATKHGIDVPPTAQGGTRAP